MAQRVQRLPAMTDFRPASEQGTVHPTALPQHGDDRDGGDIVWQEDFANGFAGNNGVGPWTTEGVDGNIWKRSVAGPNGAYTQVGQRIQSVTVANGYMLFASDSANSDWSVTPPVIVASPVSWDGALVSPVLDLSATPFLEIQFQQRLRYCCQTAPHYLEVSTDGGLNWPNRFPTSEGILVNVDPGTQLRKINISAAIAPNPANVKFRFYHEGAAGTSHYHWQLDDVKLVETYDYDLRITTAGTTNTSWQAALALSYDSIRYSVFPYSQLRPLGLNMTVLNNGAADQTDVTANFLVERGADVVLDQDVVVPSFPAGTTQTIYVAPDFTPPAVTGTYSVTMDVNSSQVDNVPGDNGGTAEFDVSPSSYGRDLGTVTGSENGNGDGGTLIVANAFYISSDAQLFSVDIAMAAGTEVGTIIRGQLRTDDISAEPIAETPEIEITAADINPANGSNFMALLFDGPQQLTALTDYMVSVQFFGVASCGASGTSEAQTSFIFYDGQAGEDWYYTTTTPMIRMGFDPSAGIEAADRSNGIGLGQNFPNPSRNTTMVPYDLAVTAPVSFEVRDLSGKVVLTRSEGTKAPGAYRLELNTANLTDGVYFYTLTAGATRLTKRMTVIR